MYNCVSCLYITSKTINYGNVEVDHTVNYGNVQLTMGMLKLIIPLTMGMYS